MAASLSCRRRKSYAFHGLTCPAAFELQLHAICAAVSPWCFALSNRMRADGFGIRREPRIPETAFSFLNVAAIAVLRVVKQVIRTKGGGASSDVWLYVAPPSVSPAWAGAARWAAGAALDGGGSCTTVA